MVRGTSFALVGETPACFSGETRTGLGVSPGNEPTHGPCPARARKNSRTQRTPTRATHARSTFKVEIPAEAWRAGGESALGPRQNGRPMPR